MLKKFGYFFLLFSLTLGLFSLQWYARGAVLIPPAVPASMAISPVSLAMPTAAIVDFEYQVLYTAQGYSPGSLEVPLGARVVFVNTSNLPLWTASDPHPTHSDLPEFDALTAQANGEKYTFQFTKAGTFGFHNHAKSVHRGIVRVVDPAHPAPVVNKTEQRQRAVREKLLSLLKPGEPDSIFAVIDTLEADKKLSHDCHDMAHDLGHRAYELYGFSGAMTFNNPAQLSHPSADDICAGGYMHGILEELFLNQPELQHKPKTVCAGVPHLNLGSCFHGVGHGLMFVSKRDISGSLAGCRSLTYLTDTHRCYEGVWMEMFWGDVEHAGANSLGWTETKPLVPCANAQIDEKPACFLYAHLGYLRTHTGDAVGAKNLCVNSGLREYDVKYCLKGIGITMMKHFTSQHLEKTETLVAGLDSGRKYAYYEGVIGYARLSHVSEESLTSFCQALQIDAFICADVLQHSLK